MIIKTGCGCEVEPLLAPFGFKGGYVNENWQVAAYVQNDGGARGLGVSTQGVLWSDAAVFEKHGNEGGNLAMFKMTERALKLLENEKFNSPIGALEAILPEVYDFGKKILESEELRMTFALNALVAADNAMWQFYAKEKNLKTFDDLIPETVRPAMSVKHDRLAVIPLVSYKVTADEINKLVDDGYFLFKTHTNAKAFPKPV